MRWSNVHDLPTSLTIFNQLQQQQQVQWSTHQLRFWTGCTKGAELVMSNMIRFTFPFPERQIFLFRSTHPPPPPADFDLDRCRCSSVARWYLQYNSFRSLRATYNIAMWLIYIPPMWRLAIVVVGKDIKRKLAVHTSYTFLYNGQYAKIVLSFIKSHKLFYCSPSFKLNHHASNCCHDICDQLYCGG